MGSSSSCAAQPVTLTLVLGGILGGKGLIGLSLWNDEMVMGQRKLREVAGHFTDFENTLIPGLTSLLILWFKVSGQTTP